MAIDAELSAADSLLPPGPPGGPTPPDSSFRRAGLLVAAIAVVVALVVAGLGTTVLGSSDAPSRWDPRLGDLPATVARLRGLPFDHPVPVRYESASRFVKERALGGASKPTAAARRAARRAAESLRALGMVSGKVDLFAAAKKARESRVLAFYDPVGKEVVIRGGTKQLDVAHRVVLAHELTHVLQDQHFDLGYLQAAVRRAPGQSPEALRAIIEGDAGRIEDRYVADLSARDRLAYRTWQRGMGEADRATADVPAVLSILQGAPYSLGPVVLQVVTAHGGNGAVDRVFEHGVFTQQLFIEPTASLTEAAPEPISAPNARTGEKRVGTTDELGAFDLYLLLASRIDPADALEGASNWAGGRTRTVRSDGRTCVRAAITTSTTSGSRELAQDLTRWSLALPKGTAIVHRDGRRLTLRSCDPGSASALSSPDVAITRAQNLLVAHNQIEVALVRQTKDAGVPRRTVQCAALEFVRSPQLSLLLAMPEQDVSADAVRDALSAAAPAVRSACGL